MKDNYISEKYEDLHNTANKGLSTTTGNDILKAYSKRVRVDYENYVTHGNLSAFESSILSGVADVDYIVENKDNAKVGNYFYVAPIKINVEGLAALKTQRDNGEISVAQYEAEVKKLFDRNKEIVSVRNAETGEVEANKITVNNLYSAIQSEVVGSEQNKIEKYRKYFYLYNDDDTNKGKDYNAVFGVDASGKAIVSDSYNNDEVKTAIEKLYNNGNAQVGDISEIVQTDEGFYIFFYAGEIKNTFDVNPSFDASSDKDNILALSKIKLNVFSSKTLLDVLFDELDANNFSVFQTMDMNNLRSKTKSIVTHKENIKDLYK